MVGQLHTSPKRQQRLLQRSARARAQGQRRPTGRRRGRPLEQLAAAAARLCTWVFWRSPLSYAWVIGLSLIPVQGLNHLASCPKLQRADPQAR